MFPSTHETNRNNSLVRRSTKTVCYRAIFSRCHDWLFQSEGHDHGFIINVQYSTVCRLHLEIYLCMQRLLQCIAIGQKTLPFGWRGEFAINAECRLSSCVRVSNIWASSQLFCYSLSAEKPSACVIVSFTIEVLRWSVGSVLCVIFFAGGLFQSLITRDCDCSTL